MGASCSRGKAREAVYEDDSTKERPVMESKAEMIKAVDHKLEKVNQYHISKLLGTGSYGRVYQATDGNGELVAIKVLDRSLLKKKGQLRKQVLEAEMREIAVMKKLNHPQCVQLFEVIDDSEHDRMFLVLELLKGGTVLDDANLPPQMKFLPESCARVVFRELILGLEYLHAHGILHRDVKPENLVYVERPPWSREAVQQHAKRWAHAKSASMAAGLIAEVANEAGLKAEMSIRQERSITGKTRPTSRPNSGRNQAGSVSMRASLKLPEGVSMTSMRMFSMRMFSMRPRNESGTAIPGVPQHGEGILAALAKVGGAAPAPAAVPSQGGFEVSQVGPLAGGCSSQGCGSSSLGEPSRPEGRKSDSLRPSLSALSTGASSVASEASSANAPFANAPSFEGRYLRANVKLLDFGVSQLVEVQSGEHDSHDGTGRRASSGIVAKATGTPAFYSPEMVANSSTKSGYDGYAADIWAAGVTLCLLAGGTLPFDADNMPEVFRLIQHEEPTLPEKASESLRQLLLGILDKDPAKRLSPKEIRCDEWLTDGGAWPMPENFSVKLEVGDEEVERAITKLTIDNLTSVLKVKLKMEQHARRASAKRSSASAGSAVSTESDVGGGEQPRPTPTNGDGATASEARSRFITRLCTH